MANPTWFIKEDYLQSKLAQLQKLDPATYGSWNIITVDEALKAAGYDNAYDHFAEFGAVERTSPNKYFDANQYLAAKAIQLNAAKHEGRTDWTADSVALAFSEAGVSPYEHFNAVGWDEGVNPSNNFDVAAYLTSKAAQLNKDKVDGKSDWTTDDVKAALKAGNLDPIAHYEVAGRTEAITVTPATNPVTPPGEVGLTFTLTDKVGEIVTGTAGDDTFSAVQGSAAGATADSTLNIGDTVDGGAGTDTMTITLAGAAAGAFPAGSSVKNVEIVNLVHTNNTAFDGTIAATAQTTSTSYAGIKQLWQVDNDSTAVATSGTFSAVVVGADVTAGFRSNGVTGTTAGTSAAAVLGTATVGAAAASQTALSVALDGIGHNSILTFDGAGVKTINVSGSVAAEATGNAGDLTIANVVTAGAAVATIAETIKVSTTSAVDLIIDQTGGAAGNAFGATVKTIDASAATGAIRANATNGAAIDNSVLTGLTSVELGSGNDNVAFTLGGTKALAIDAAAGNDTITLGGTAAAGNLVSVTLGEGKDTIVIANNLANLGSGINNDANLTARITTIEDFNTAEDVINLGGTGVALDSSAIESIKLEATLVAAATAAANLAGGVGGQVVFSWGDDAYVYTDVAVAGLSTDDSLVKIVGLDAADLSTGQNGNLVL